MDPNGETRVDTDSNADEVVNTTNDVQEDQVSKEQLNVPSPSQKDAESSTQQAQPVEETAQTLPSTQPDQESSANNAPDEKNEDHDDKEIGKEKEKEKESQPTQSKQWKNPRKKKNKDEQVRDAAQWPTPDEARHGRGPPKKNQGEPGRNPSKSERDKQSRAKKGINWKPLSDISKSQGTSEQSSSIGGAPSASSAVGTEGERVGATQSSGPASSTAGSGRGYQGAYGRGQPKRRGGRGPWPRSHAGGAQHFSQEGTNVPSENVAPETEGKDNAQVSQNIQDSGASSPPQAGQTYVPQESRRYRGSLRGTSSRPSNRWRGGGGGGGYSRPSYFNRYNPPRGGQPLAPLTVPQDPEQLREQVKKQIEYYFGVDNLCKDIFLRKNMNNESGWISIHLILNFNRVRELNIDLQGFVDALKDSTVVEIKDEFVRRREDWARWTFPPRVEGGSQQNSQTQEDSTITEPISQ
jgi:la-related protein 1